MLFETTLVYRPSANSTRTIKRNYAYDAVNYADAIAKQLDGFRRANISEKAIVACRTYPACPEASKRIRQALRISSIFEPATI